MSSLAETRWELAAINGEAILADSRVTLIFTDTHAGGYAGCNNYGTPYTSEADGSLKLSEIALNAALCLEPEGIMAQESRFVEALLQVESYKIEGETLALSTAGGDTLTFNRQTAAAMNPADLIGTAWALESWGARELINEDPITLNFEDEANLTGFAGCRHYEATYEADEHTIRLPYLSMVEMDCSGSDALLNFEGDFTTALSQIDQYTLSEDRLTLLTQPGERLVFMRADGG